MRRLAATVVAAVALLVLTAGPAAAAPPVGGITSPDEGAVLTTKPTLSASYSQPGGIIDSIVLGLTSERGDKTQNKVEPGNGRSSVAVTWAPNFAYNGRYVFTARATGTERPVDPEPGETTPTATRTFSLALLPAVPTGVQATVRDRTPSVTWRANTEPDLVGYQVERARGDSAAFDPVGITTRPQFTDTTVPSPGNYRYRVRAVRQGATDSPDDGLASDASRPSGQVTVAAPPTTTTQADESTTGSGGGTAADGSGGSGGTGGTGGSTASGSTGTSGRSGPAIARTGKVDLSGFRSLLGRSASGTSAAPTPADPGFQETLPFDGSAPVEDEPVVGESGTALGEQLTIEEAGETRDDSTIEFLAGALLLFVMAMGVLLVRAEVDRAPLDALEPSTATRPPPVDPVASIATVPQESTRARRAAPRVPPQPAGDRRQGRPAVRTRR